MQKLDICVLFGGVSSEHEISLITAKGIIDNLDRAKYNVHPLGITRDGRWLLFNGDSQLIPTGEWEARGIKGYISPDRSDGGIITINGTNGNSSSPGDFERGLINIDLVYLALHGEHGEDGTMQGLLKLAGIPYIGANTLSSALCMDKAMTKMVLKAHGIPQAEFLTVYYNQMEHEDALVQSIEKVFSYPVFVKPSNVGSSIGAAKAKNRKELVTAISDGLKCDYKVLVEEYIDADEIECGIIGNRDMTTGSLAKVVMNSEFYDYETKYTPGMTVNEIPAQIPDELASKIKRMASIIYNALDVEGLGRVDFFVEKEGGRILFNELNTLPGFTPYSAFPGMFNDVGIDYPDLLDKIINLALERN